MNAHLPELLLFSPLGIPGSKPGLEVRFPFQGACSSTKTTNQLQFLRVPSVKHFTVYALGNGWAVWVTACLQMTVRCVGKNAQDLGCILCGRVSQSLTLREIRGRQCEMKRQWLMSLEPNVFAGAHSHSTPSLSLFHDLESSSTVYPRFQEAGETCLPQRG